ncbi:MAG: STAS domain-containing protein [Leptospirales bacterium]|jgi:anti-anti-sigma factor
MKCDVSTHENYSLIRIYDDHLAQTAFFEIGSLVQEALQAGPSNLILDMSHIDFVDSLAVGALMAANMTCKQLGGGMVLANVAERITKIAIIATSNTLVVAPSVEDAARSFLN